MATEGQSPPMSWRDSYKGMSSDNIKGLILALSSSLCIGASFIVKKKGLKKAGAGIRAGVGGYSYLYEPLWWVSMIMMIVGEIANFAAYAFAPAILVTPLGALSIIMRHLILSTQLWYLLYTMFVHETLQSHRGLGQTKSNSGCHRNVWVCEHPWRNFSSSQNEGYG